ncbi:MAG TPA: hypothetical protein V6D17_03160 [Candidatus Obscuribacterales bacterium]
MNSFGASVILAMVVMGALAVFVLMPIACIEWTWNFAASILTMLPPINAWQAALLYLAMALILNISGVLHIEFKADTID